jgi:hypothetical protein
MDKISGLTPLSVLFSFLSLSLSYTSFLLDLRLWISVLFQEVQSTTGTNIDGDGVASKNESMTCATLTQLGKNIGAAKDPFGCGTCRLKYIGKMGNINHH